MSGVKGAGNVTVTYNDNAITDYLDSTQLAAVVAELESTNLGSTAQTYEPGLANWQANIDLTNWDSTLDGYLAVDAVTPAKRTVVIVVTDSDSTDVTYTWTTNGFITGYSITASPNELIKAPGLVLRLSGAPGRT